MTVHLLRAPDYWPTDYFDVCTLLQAMSLPGWTFIVPETEIDPESIKPQWGGSRRNPEDLQFAYHSPVEKIMYDTNRQMPLSWQELFEVCEFYRRCQDVNPTDVVVLLTRRPNALNWFSAFDRAQNVFIHTADWERYIVGEPKYAIAYEVLANTLQLSMGLAFDTKQAYLHERAIGCMNDLCVDKTQIAFKLRTADICGTCLDRLKQAEVPDLAVAGALDGFDQIRTQLLFRQGFRRAAQPGPVLINRHYQLVFPEQGHLAVSLTPLSRTVYIFFLRHPEGVRLADLCDYRAELFSIYERLSRSGSRTAMDSSISRLVDVRQNTLNENLSRIRRALLETLGETLATPYLITGESGGVYRIRLVPHLIRQENEA